MATISERIKKPPTLSAWTPNHDDLDTLVEQVSFEMKSELAEFGEIYVAQASGDCLTVTYQALMAEFVENNPAEIIALMVNPEGVGLYSVLAALNNALAAFFRPDPIHQHATEHVKALVAQK